MTQIYCLRSERLQGGGIFANMCIFRPVERLVIISVTLKRNRRSEQLVNRWEWKFEWMLLLIITKISNCGTINEIKCNMLVWNVYFNYIVQYSLYHNIDIGTMWHWALVSCTPSQSIGLVLGCAFFWCSVSSCVPLNNSSIEFYSIMIVVTIIGILLPSFYSE